MNHKNQTKEALVKAAVQFRIWRAKADELKAQRAKVLGGCTGSQREFGHPPCPKYWKSSMKHKWCDGCLSTADINAKYRSAANKATGWQRSLYHWCDELKGA